MAVELSIAVEARNVIGLNCYRDEAAGAIDFRRHTRRKTRICEVPHGLTARMDSITILQLRDARFPAIGATAGLADCSPIHH